MRRLGGHYTGRVLLIGVPLILLLLYLAGCVATGAAQPQSSLPATPVAPAPAGATGPVTSVATAPAAQSPAVTPPETPKRAASPTSMTSAVAEPSPPIVVRPSSTAPSPSPGSAPTVVPSPRSDIRLALRPVIQGLDRPLFVTNAGDGSGRLFVVEKPGVIRIWDAGRLLSAPFLDIRDRVLSRGSEQGLLGLAFSPDYIHTGYFFVDYIDLSGNTVVSRFRVTGDANVADPASEFKVLGIDQPAANHNGGNLVFGPDGYLWIGTGDGGAANDRFRNGQNPQTLLGKMLRLDVTSDPSKPYRIPQDNPWVNAKWNGQDIRAEIWAVGLRNPWRYSFDRATGDLWIADVGQNAYEEVNLVPADVEDPHQGAAGGVHGGLNFGWPIMEGTHCLPDSTDCKRDELVLPVTDYQHGANGCSITGGYVYRGSQYPALSGVYLYGDYCSGRIWGLSPAAGGGWQNRLLLESGLAISSFGEDQSGELYVVDLSGGAVYQVVAS